MDAEKVLEKILADYVRDYKSSNVIKAINRKIEKGIYRYSEAEMLAQESGRILEDAFRKYLPEALTDGKLYRATAEVVLKNPMLQSSRDVRDTALRIQRGLNEQAGIGIQAIAPEVNEEQINGIITGICNANSFSEREETLYDQVTNFLEGTVDDCVRENADFQYRAGLSPKIERRAVGKCCAWCSRLAGIYEYADVSDKGNDVFRRHKNCHCIVSYNPGDGSKRRQNVHSKQWTDGRNNDIIKKPGNMLPLNLQLFAHKTGDYRRAEHGHEWEELSLKDTLARFAKGSKPIKSDDKQKISYFSKNGKYEVKYDVKGDYFRIKDLMSESKSRPCLDKNGLPVLNITEDGKTRSATQEEYERATHFRNSDVKGGGKR